MTLPKGTLSITLGFLSICPRGKDRNYCKHATVSAAAVTAVFGTLRWSMRTTVQSVEKAHVRQPCQSVLPVEILKGTTLVVRAAGPCLLRTLRLLSVWKQSGLQLV